MTAPGTRGPWRGRLPAVLREEPRYRLLFAGQATARVAAYDWGTSVGLMPIALALAGPVRDAIGLQTAMRWGTGLGIAAALACLAVPAVRQVRRAR